jgi:RimJ/RimL family protein N-acetyltransferase
MAPVEPIEGLSIRLWCIALKDASAIAEIMTPDVSRWLASWPPNLTVEAAAERISRAQSAMQEKRELHFRVEERERNLTIGYVSVAQSATDRGVGHLSYWLGSAFQGKGYMTEAVRHAFGCRIQIPGS